MRSNLSLEDYFIDTYFYDLLPLAKQLAEESRYTEKEMVEAICLVYDKFCQFPPKSNRTAWFKVVFREKLREARGNILGFASRKNKYS